ncbi:DNA-processing protein DprA [Demequina sp. TTPB684]|uniref:DNA-processing protein DprA n=1 Tax=unclassified Demequina TaxID=2620311 RepID=UPI001CF16E6E|nr:MULTISPECIES: DNA-processing protein DprA [unclassified Demequina]MCB2413147.1 DNA-processing protein DprA [Demequina sp. TTPB684]UPU89653.1 DNA-processing protein DprA [Demequina sp. TMPB413]
MTLDARDALIAWSAIAEPGDAVAGALVESWGPGAALEWVIQGCDRLASEAARLAESAGPELARSAARAHERWAARLDRRDEPHERRARAVGARVVTREDAEWPGVLGSLGQVQPFALYVRGDASIEGAWEASVAVVGSRSATSYGSYMAGEIAGGVADAGRAVVSGGAYGIDAAAHRAALSQQGLTIAVMAGGIDRLYPAGNDELLKEIVGSGAVVSEVPPGFAPHRSRFLSRNRLIACASVTVVVEAAHRSGALSTARHAAELVRPVAAVPGPVTSASSAGCHALIRDGVAVLVTDASEVLELAASLTEVAVDVGAPALPSQSGPLEFGSLGERRMFDALTRRAKASDAAAAAAGMTSDDARAALGALEMTGLAERHRGGWRRA